VSWTARHRRRGLSDGERDTRAALRSPDHRRGHRWQEPWAPCLRPLERDGGAARGRRAASRTAGARAARQELIRARVAPTQDSCIRAGIHEDEAVTRA
jgi:hypothetical protein